MKKIPMLVDSHAHLDVEEFEKDRSSVVERARAEGVNFIITVGCDLNSSLKALEYSKRYESAYAALGIHPHDAKRAAEGDLDQIEGLLDEPKVVAIGEIGLDYYRNYSPRDAQVRQFRKQIGLARERGLPIIVHNRNAEGDALKIMREEAAGDVGGVMHCFSGSIAFAEKCADLGFYISFAGPITFPNARRLREVAAHLPVERMMVETDCPFLAPEPHRGERNEPAYAIHVARALAEVKKLSYEDICRITTLNVHKSFGIGQIAQAGAISYKIRDSLYLNITNRCTSSCYFCKRQTYPVVKGHNLRLAAEPTAEEIMGEISDHEGYREVVFCGYGEPTLRLDIVKEVSRRLKQKGIRVRLNTNGHGNLIHKRTILPELVGLVDEVCVSLNAESAEKYFLMCMPKFGESTYNAVREFIMEAKKYIPRVSVTLIEGLPEIGADVEACKKIASDELGGVELRLRQYDGIG